MNAFIPLTRGLFAIVDAEDFAVLSEWNWRALRSSTIADKWYAIRDLTVAEQAGGPPGTISMHRWLYGVPAGLDIDHANGNGLDNRRANLRVCTRAQNIQNTRAKKMNLHGFRGVARDKKKFVATIRVDGERHRFGPFLTPLEAALAARSKLRRVRSSSSCSSLCQEVLSGREVYSETVNVLHVLALQAAAPSLRSPST
jgi:hypothetical protein